MSETDVRNTPASALTARPQLKTFEQHRSRLYGIAYRMLGSASDAEDVLQDAYLRWRDVRLNEVESAGAYLASMVSRICIDRMRRAKVERLLYTGPWLPEPIDEQTAAGLTAPEATRAQAESISMGFLMLLQNLPPLERAVFILREAFDLPHDQIAAMLEIQPAHSRQLLRRGKSRIDQAETVENVSEDTLPIMEKFLEAATSGKLDALQDLMTDDIIAFSDGGGRVSAAIIPLIGRDRVSTVLVHLLGKLDENLTISWSTLNGRPAMVIHDGEKIHSTHSVQVRDGRICRIYTMRNPRKLRHVSIRSLQTRRPVNASAPRSP